jgi:competence protein ComEC
MFESRLHKKFIILGLLFVGAFLIWLAVFTQVQANLLEITFFDVGQGEAIFVETPQGHQILIDGGSDATILEKLGQAMPFYDQSIDLIILTHPEADHLSGLVEVLRYYQVGQILENGIQRNTPEYQEWMKLIQKKEIPLKIAQAGQVVHLGPGVNLRILWPDQRLVQSEARKVNNVSIVAQLIYGQSEFLLTGDIEKQIELRLINQGLNLESDVLKIGHHGSKTSSSQIFLEAVNPKIAVISVGKNSYGHPHQEVLERLKKIKVYQTDKDGDVEIITDGMIIEARTEK